MSSIAGTATVRILCRVVYGSYPMSCPVQTPASMRVSRELMFWSSDVACLSCEDENVLALSGGESFKKVLFTCPLLAWNNVLSCM